MGVRMSDDETWEFIEGGHTAILTTLRRDGWPVSLPVWYVVADRVIYVATPARSKKVLRICHDDRACLLVERGEAWVELAAVELAVRAMVVESGAEAATADELFARKYAAFRPAPVGLPDVTKKHYSGQVVLRFDPVEPALTWDNARIRLPRH